MNDDEQQSVANQIEEELERLILTGEIAPGARINENAMASRFGVSRAPIREACRLLQRAGLVDILPNRGSVVREPTLREILNLFDIRAGLAGLAGRLAATMATGERIEAMQRLILAMDEASDSRDAERYVGLNLDFHATLLGATGNARLAALDAQLGKELRIYRRHGLAFGGGLKVSNSEHRTILAAIERGDTDAAGVEFENHIVKGRDRFVRAMTATGQLTLSAPAQPRTRRRTREKTT